MTKELALHESDSVIIKELVKHYDKNFVGLVTFSEKEIEGIVEYVTKIKYGSSVWTALICLGQNECVYKRTCPIAHKPPLGKMCPFEQLAMTTWFDDYVKSLEVDINDKVERSQVTDIVEADILNARANAVLGSESFIMENPVGTDPDTGNVVYRKEEHVAMRIKDKAQVRRDKILKAFIATREAKVKTLANNKEDPTVYFARLAAAAQALQMKHSAIDVAIQQDGPDNESKPEQVEGDTTGKDA